ncbi:MAG TPA: hypothetical protein DDW42_05480 [Desulfobacteraceae bacterium]|nr:hypothetical protein [Desulfobacteraceae bacterium]
MENKKKVPQIVRLMYKPGEMIIKEGDYGISMYKINNGEVHIFNRFGGKDIITATLGAGEVFGEMSFLNRGRKPRRTSARAVENTELEVWHPDRFSKEYDQMPAVIRYITNQTLKRLIRMNMLVSQLGEKVLLVQEKGKQKSSETPSSKRGFYRKEVDLKCVCRPLRYSSNTYLTGWIKDISREGIGLEVTAGKSQKNSTYKPGSEFQIDTVLPNGKELSFTARIISTGKEKKGRTAGRLFLGMNFTEMSADSRRILGFFLMP